MTDNRRIASGVLIEWGEDGRLVWAVWERRGSKYIVWYADSYLKNNVTKFVFSGSCLWGELCMTAVLSWSDAQASPGNHLRSCEWIWEGYIMSSLSWSSLFRLSSLSNKDSNTSLNQMSVERETLSSCRPSCRPGQGSFIYDFTTQGCENNMPAVPQCCSQTKII